jgi:hypothetical protein
MEMEKCQFKQIFVSDAFLDPMKVRTMKKKKKTAYTIQGAQMSTFLHWRQAIFGKCPYLVVCFSTTLPWFYSSLEFHEIKVLKSVGHEEISSSGIVLLAILCCY